MDSRRFIGSVLFSTAILGINAFAQTVNCGPAPGNVAYSDSFSTRYLQACEKRLE
jgi:hypothetical protein